MPDEITIEQLEAAWKEYQDFHKEQKDLREAAIHTLLQEFLNIYQGARTNFKAFQDLRHQHLLEIQELQQDKIQLTEDCIQALYTGRIINPPATPGSISTVQVMPKDQKSGKMPHPDPLTDGVSPFIDDWLETIRTKLSVNADWYPTK